jgi:hypothetical protein
MARRTLEADRLTEVILEVFRVNGRLLGADDRLTADSGQSSARWQIVGAIRRPETALSVARARGPARQSGTANILEAARLIDFQDNPTHRRSRLLQLTCRGKQVLDVILSRQVAWTNEFGRRRNLSGRHPCVRGAAPRVRGGGGGPRSVGSSLTE